MSLPFWFSRLCIRNFRGIEELDVDLPAKIPIHLIGGNNSCKSTVLYSFALALGGGGTHNFLPRKYDFFHNYTGRVANEFTVTLNLGAHQLTDLPAVQGLGNPVPVHGIRVIGSRDRQGRFRHQRVLIGADGKTITFSQRSPLKGQTKEDYAGQGLGWRPVNARPDETTPLWR
jgi:hypothetical protein